MTLTSARACVRQFSRNGGIDAGYSDADVDRAIQFVGNRFLRLTRCVKTASTVTLTDETAAFSVSSVTGFRPERLIRAWLTLSSAIKSILEVVDHRDILQLQIDSDNSTDSTIPTHLAFTGWAAGVVHPIPDEAYTLNLLWYDDFTSWTAGTETPGSVTLNIPDDLLAEILPWGVPAILQHNDLEHAYASVTWQKYLELETAMRGVGNLGARSSERNLEE